MSAAISAALFEIYVVERRLFRSSREHEIVGAYAEYSDAVEVRDQLPAPGGKITTVKVEVTLGAKGSYT